MMLTGTLMLSQPPQPPHQQANQQFQPYNHLNSASSSSSSSTTSTTNSSNSNSSNLLLTTANLTANGTSSTIVQPHNYQHQESQPQHHTQINTISHLISNSTTSKYYHGQSNGHMNPHTDLGAENNHTGGGDPQTSIYKSSSSTHHVLPRTANCHSYGPTPHQQQFDQVSLSSTHNANKYRPNGIGPVYSSNSLSSTHIRGQMQQQDVTNQLNNTKSVYFDAAQIDKSIGAVNTESVYERTRDKRGARGDNYNDGSRSRRPRDDEDIDQGVHNYSDQKKIEVQILPQDDNWGENTTAMTADFSDINDDMTEDGRSIRFQLNPGPPHKPDQINSNRRLIDSLQRLISKYISIIFTTVIFLSSFLTPVLFITIPRLELTPDWQLNECGLECEGILIGISFKLFVLLLGYWAMYMSNSRRRNNLPRVYELKALLVFVLVIMTFSYWLFYGVRIIDTRVSDYYKILQFTASYVDVLLIVFVVSVFVLELRHLKPAYVVRVVRSPDGEQREYDLGTMSIQRAALFILDQYYRDFRVYNPWLESAHRKRTAQLVQLEQINCKRRARGVGSASSMSSKRGETGVLDMDSQSGGDANFNDTESAYKRGSLSRRSNGKPLDVQSVTNIMGANLSANDRLYEEYEYDRRLKKRKARLITTTEEAFANIRRVQQAQMIETEGTDRPSGMDPYEAAQALFSTIARDLRRYLRLTRQHPYFTRDHIVAHLANCIAYGISPKAFLQKFTEGESLLFNDRALVNPFNQDKHVEYQQELIAKQQEQQKLGNNYTSSVKTLDQTWILISDNALYQNVEDNLMIVLKQNDVTLMCTFKRLPRFKLIEDILDPKRNKFVLKVNSETTV